MTDLYILRHGNTFDKGDVVRRVGAGTNLPLSVSGVMQATALAAHFEEAGIAFARVFSSPLQRALMTADIVSGGADIDIVTSLTEIDYGPDEGKPETEVVARVGVEALEVWEQRAEPPPGWVADPARLVRDWRDFFSRCATLEGPVLAVTSNGVARFALDAADACDGEFARKLATAAYGCVTIDAGGRAVVTRWNVTAA